MDQSCCGDDKGEEEMKSKKSGECGVIYGESASDSLD